MSRRSQPPRVVIDTNLIVSALVFSQGKSATLRQAWQNAICLPLISKVTASELIRVLAYPKFKLDTIEQNELLADYIPWCTAVTIPRPLPKTPACRDVFDIPFLQLAIAGKADYLITGDKDLRSVANFSCPILTMEKFLPEMKIG